jgi:hypothetical protein
MQHRLRHSGGLGNRIGSSSGGGWTPPPEYVAFQYDLNETFISGATTYITDQTEGKQNRELLSQNGVTGKVFTGEGYHFLTSLKQYCALTKDIIIADNTAFTFCFRVINGTTSNAKGLLGHDYSAGVYSRITIRTTSDATPTSRGIALYNEANASVFWAPVSLIPREGVVESYLIRCNGTDVDNLELFQNGESCGLKTLAGTSFVFNKLASVGSATLYSYDGTFLEFAYFKRCLTDLEVQQWQIGEYIGNYEAWHWFGNDVDASGNAYNLTRQAFDGTSIVIGSWRNFKNTYGYGVKVDTTIITPKMTSATPTVDTDNVPLVFTGKASMHLIEVDANTIKARDNVYELIEITNDIVGNDYYTAGVANNILKANLNESELNNQYYKSTKGLYLLENMVIIPNTINPLIQKYLGINKKGLNYLAINYNNVDFATFVIETFQVNDTGPKANPGLAYDKFNHNLLIFNYNTTLSSDIRVMHRRERGVAYASKTYTDYTIFPTVLYIEGLGYDAENKIYYAWGGNRQALVSPTYYDWEIIIVPFRLIGGVMVQCGVARTNDLGDGVPGMVSWDYNLNGLWIKPYTAPAGVTPFNGYAKLFRVNLKGAWTLIKEVNCKKEDGDTSVAESIACSEFDTTLWGDNSQQTRLIQWDENGNVLLANDNPTYHYYHALSPAWSEGTIVDPTDQTIWFNADNGVHDGGTPIPEGNAIWHIDPLHTYNKNLFFPRMIGWDKGKLDTNVAIRDSILYLINNALTGVWISPVIDFIAYTMQQTLTNYTYTNDDGKTVTMTFRGSDVAPDTTEDKSFALSFWDANNAGTGWGTTVPGAYQGTVPNNRYVQIKITIS